MNHLLKIVKISVGSLISMTIAQGLGLNYSSSAAVITLLSIHDTKRETIRVTGKRIMAFLGALLIGPVCFGLAGYRPLALGMFLLLFTPLCMRWKMQEGISVNTVLMTHFLSEGSMAAGNIANEALLLIIGAGVGILLNMYIPGAERSIRRAQREIEEIFIRLLGQMADMLEGNEGREFQAGFDRLDQVLSAGEGRAYENIENSLLSDTRYYLSYMNLRRSQSVILGRIQSGLERLSSLPAQAAVVAGMFRSVSLSFHECNNALELLQQLEDVKSGMKVQPLPAGREEFENRALLYLVLLELEQLLEMKKEFVKNLSAGEIRRFWADREPCSPN